MSDEQVRVECPKPECQGRFRVDVATIPAGTKGKEARCRACGDAFFVRKAGDTLEAVTAEALAEEAKARAPVPKHMRQRGLKPQAPKPRAPQAEAKPTPGTTTASVPSSGLEGTPFGIGDRVGRYEVEAVLARGGMGGIYKVYDPAANRHVALKVLVSTATELDRLRFQREIQVQGNIQHPHIMPIFDSGMIGKTRYYTMELLKDPIDMIALVDQARRGEAIKDPKLRPVATLEGMVRGIVVPLCEAVYHANANEGVLHRDLKPGNILVDRNGLRPFVIDFGVSSLLEKKNARLAHLDRELPVPLRGKGVHVTGTLVFMPPEQARGIADRRGDVWALGSVLHYMVTGEPPIEPAIQPQVSVAERIDGLKMLIEQARAEGNQKEVAEFEHKLADMRAGRERSLEDVRRDVLRGRYQSRPTGASKGLDAVIRKAMMPNPEERYRHALDLRDDLDAWLEGRPVRAMVRSSGAAGGLLYRTRLLLRRHRIGVAALLLVAALAAAAVHFWPQEKKVDHARIAQQHMDRAVYLRSNGKLDGARRSAREALRADPERADAFAFLRRIDSDERLFGDLQRARALEQEAKAAFAGGDVAAGVRAKAAIEEVVTSSVLPAITAEEDAGTLEAMNELLRFARGQRVLRIGGLPSGVKLQLIPLDEPGGAIRWSAAAAIPESTSDVTPQPYVTPGAWLLRAKRASGEVLVPFFVDHETEPVVLTCPVDPGTLDAESVYVGGGQAPGPGGPKVVAPLIWDRGEVTAARYAAYLKSLPSEEQRRRVPRIAGALGSVDQPLWDAVGSTFDTPSGATRRPVEGISLYDARAFAAFEGKRLPTAAEWAWASTGPDRRLCAVGRMRDLIDSKTRIDSPLAGVADVMTAPADRSPFGLFDMAGNVSELTSTLGTLRGETGWFVMGGSYRTPHAGALVTSARVVPGWLPLQGVGLRCVREPK